MARTISRSYLSKTYNMTGWRLGYVVRPETVIAGARKVHDFLTVGAAAVPCSSFFHEPVNHLIRLHFTGQYAFHASRLEA